MRKWAAMVLALAAGSCDSGPHWRSEEFSQYYAGPSKEKGTRNLDRRKIVYRILGADNKVIAASRVIGVLETNEVLLEGSRRPRRHYAILNDRLRRVGFISEEGRVSRYDSTGRHVEIGEYPVLVKGIKVFFGIPLTDPDRNHVVELVEIDPYRDF